MTRSVDGCAFDVPPLTSQIIELAHHHRKN